MKALKLMNRARHPLHILPKSHSVVAAILKVSIIGSRRIKITHGYFRVPIGFMRKAVNQPLEVVALAVCFRGLESNQKRTGRSEADQVGGVMVFLLESFWI